MTQRAVPLFAPPVVRPRSTPRAQQFPALPAPQDHSGLMLAMGRIDHSGRVGDRQLIAALGWQSEDAYGLTVSADRLLVWLDPAGPFRINIRGHVFIPAATRRILGVKAGDSLVLLARPEHGTMAVHPTSLVTALLARHHTAPAVSRDH